MSDPIAEIVDWQMRNPEIRRFACGVCHVLWTGVGVCPECGGSSVIEDRIAAVIAEHHTVYHGSAACRCGKFSAGSVDFDGHDAHVAAAVVAELQEPLLPIIASAIRGYASCESQALSYHGDESGIETLQKLDREADGIAAYAFTSTDWKSS